MDHDELRVLDVVKRVAARTRPVSDDLSPERRLDAALDHVCAALADLGYDAGNVATLVVFGLNKGRQVYGPLRLAEDRRDFSGEAAAELRDAAVYLAGKLLQLEDEPL